MFTVALADATSFLHLIYLCNSGTEVLGITMYNYCDTEIVLLILHLQSLIVVDTYGVFKEQNVRGNHICF